MTERQKNKRNSKVNLAEDADMAKEFWLRKKPQRTSSKNRHFIVPKKGSNIGKKSQVKNRSSTSMAHNKTPPKPQKSSDLAGDNPVPTAKAIICPRNGKYPSMYPPCVGGHLLDEQDVRSLKPREWLNDNIRNAFVHNQVELAQIRGSDICYMNTILCSLLITDELTDGLKRGLSRGDYWTYKCLLMPVNITGNHWALIIVDFERQFIVYLDSLHYAPKQEYMDRVLTIGLRATIPAPSKHDVMSWSFYAPVDITHQEDTVSCGVYTCLRVYAVCNSLVLSFDHSDAVYARKGIAQILSTASISHVNRDMKNMRELFGSDVFSTLVQEVNNCKLRIIRQPPSGFNSTVIYLGNLLKYE